MGGMRQRVARVAVVAVLVALVLLAVPLAVVIRASFFADERGELERDALAAAVRVSPQFAKGDPVELPPARSDGRLGVYDATTMRLRAGSGRATADAVTRQAAASGSVAQRRTGGELVVAVPVSSAERVIGVVRASSPASGVWGRVLLAWAALLSAALVALGVAILVARRQARALTAPLEALSRTSRTVAEGDLSARAATSGIAEINQVARTHNAMVESLARLLQHERNFTANASHQLRTPLTGLQLGLETALTTAGTDLRAAVAEALEQCGHLHRTIDEVLRLAKADVNMAGQSTPQPAGELLEGMEQRWHGPLAQDGRRIELALDAGTADLPLPGRTTDQILDILLDNAHRHGRGTVTVTLRDIGGALALDVSDEGTVRLPAKTLFDRGSTTGPGQGIGLSLAADLAETAGGRLTLAQAEPTRFTLLLPYGLHEG